MTSRLTIDQAAARLHVHPGTLRRRLKRGQVRGVREETPSGIRWLIELPDDDAQAAPEQPAPDASATLTLTLERDALAQEVRRLSTHVDDLRTQLEHRAREVAELHVTMNRLLVALPAPPPDAAAAPAHATPTHGDAPPAQGQTGRLGWWGRVSTWFSGA